MSSEGSANPDPSLDEITTKERRKIVASVLKTKVGVKGSGLNP